MNRNPMQRGGQRPFQGPRNQQSQPPSPSLGGEYLKQGYFDVKGNLWPNLIVEEAQRVARLLNQGGQIKVSQIRRFFGKARNIQQKLEAGQPFDNLVAEIRTMQPLAANAVAKGNAPAVFREFIDRNIALAARDSKHFISGFLAHFQSVVCYFTLFNSQSQKS